MHKLDRSIVTSPECLSHYRHGQHNWGNVCREHKSEIREALRVIQGWRCAYCECIIRESDCDVEHFRQRARYPKLTFEWTNLFLSCRYDDSCGRHKDSCECYDFGDLLKPDEDDPEQYFYFASDGTIDIRSELNERQRKRAQETLRVFNLNPRRGRLRTLRETAVFEYYHDRQFISELVECGEIEDAQQYLAQLLCQIMDKPFCTAIKHYLT